MGSRFLLNPVLVLLEDLEGMGGDEAVLFDFSHAEPGEHAAKEGISAKKDGRAVAPADHAGMKGAGNESADGDIQKDEADEEQQGADGDERQRCFIDRALLLEFGAQEGPAGAEEIADLVFDFVDDSTEGGMLFDVDVIDGRIWFSTHGVISLFLGAAERRELIRLRQRQRWLVLDVD